MSFCHIIDTINLYDTIHTCTIDIVSNTVFVNVFICFREIGLAENHLNLLNDLFFNLFEICCFFPL